MRYKAKVRFIFEGEVTVIADNKTEAGTKLRNDFGLSLGGTSYYTT